MKQMMKLFDTMNDMKNMFAQQIEQQQKKGYERMIELEQSETKKNIDQSMMNKIYAGYLLIDYILHKYFELHGIRN